MPDVRVITIGDGWAVVYDHASRPLSVHTSRAAAERAAEQVVAEHPEATGVVSPGGGQRPRQVDEPGAPGTSSPPT